MKKNWTDEALVEGCLKCDPLAQRALYDKFVQAMYNTVYRYTLDHQDTQDVMQNAFEKVFKYLDKYDHKKGSLLSWVRKIHVRSSLDHIKKQKVRFTDIEDINILISSYSISYENMEAEYIMDLINDLSPLYRTIFNLHQIEGYSHEEISKMLTGLKKSLK